jgi:glutamate dehydrogenase (NAD(P)+)
VNTSTSSPHRPTLSITWVDPETGVEGFLVIDRLVRGVSSGGLRMRAGCTLDEVAGLAAGMTVKEALHYRPGAQYVPLGGAKGGLSIDPRDPRSQAVLERFLGAIKPIAQRHWTMGEDLGLTQSRLDAAVEAVGMTSPVEAIFPLLPNREESERRLARALHTLVDGILLDALIGGFGVAEATLALLERDATPPSDARVAIQGLGTMGGAAARYLARAGTRVVAVSDALGAIVNPRGLDIETLLAARDAFGVVDRAALGPEDREAPGAALLATDADVLIPAAISYAITPADVDAIRARYIVEAANMPVTADAEAALNARGVRVLPDVLANSGTNAWWWQVAFGDVDGTADQSFAYTAESIRSLVDEMLEEPAATWREAVTAIADRRLEEIERRYGGARAGQAAAPALSETDAKIARQNLVNARH